MPSLRIKSKEEQDLELAIEPWGVNYRVKQGETAVLDWFDGNLDQIEEIFEDGFVAIYFSGGVKVRIRINDVDVSHPALSVASIY